MTLPRIESTLNPNAPDFTSRGGAEFNPREFSTRSAGYLHAQHQLALLQQQQQQQRNEGRGGTGLAHQDLRVPPPSGPPPPGSGPPPPSMLSQQSFNTLLQQAANLGLPPEYSHTQPGGSSGGAFGQSSGFSHGHAHGHSAQGGGSAGVFAHQGPGRDGPSSAGAPFLSPALMGGSGTIPPHHPATPQRPFSSPMQQSQSAASNPSSQHHTPSKGTVHNHNFSVTPSFLPVN